MNKKLIFKTVYILLLCMIIGSLVFSSSSISVDEGYYNGLFSLIDMLYRNELGTDEIMGASLNGAFEGMSEYSCFEAVSRITDESFSGIGANLEKVRMGFRIVSVNPSSSAFKAGLEAGDIIYRIDKQNTSVMGVDFFKSYMNANESALFEIINRDSGLIRSVRIEAEPDYRKDVDFVILDNAGYIRINTFSDSTAGLVEKVLESLVSQDNMNIILDLRELVSMNIEDACSVAKLLSPGGTLARTGQQSYNAARKEIPFNISILVNGNTAGGGEVIANAVPAVIYGEATAGEAVHIVKYPVFSENAYSKYSRDSGSDDVKRIVSYLNARNIEIPEHYIIGYISIVESGVFDSDGKLISQKNKVEPDVVVENTEIGYMDYKPDGDMIEIRRDYSEGNVNYDIFIAKKVLSALEIYKGSLDVVFGSDMTKAVNEYKESIGYAVNGILDRSTQAMLNTYSMKTAVLDDNCVKAALVDFEN